MNFRNTENYFNLPFNKDLKEKARCKRKFSDLSEVLLWNKFKNKQFKSFDFDRQKIIGNYIVNFYCTNKKVVIEILEGDENGDKTEEMKIFLNGLGLSKIELEKSVVLHKIAEVIAFLEGHSLFTSAENHPRSHLGYLSLQRRGITFLFFNLFYSHKN